MNDAKSSVRWMLHAGPPSPSVDDLPRILADLTGRARVKFGANTAVYMGLGFLNGWRVSFYPPWPAKEINLCHQEFACALAAANAMLDRDEVAELNATLGIEPVREAAE